MNGCKISIGTFSPKGDVSLMGKDCTFENFVNGKMTAAAYWSCEEVASNPGRKHNPLCICGPTGVGKTHLVCALLYKLRVVHPELKSVIVPSETFMNEMIYCLRLNKMEDIRMKYRGCDLFAIDNKCKSKYTILDGSPNSGPSKSSLIRYHTSFDGQFVHVYN